MRNSKTSLSLIAVVLLATSGCQMFSPDPAASFKTFQDVWTVAFAAYDAHCERVVQGKVEPAKEAAADLAWNQFRTTFRAAFVATSQNWAAAPPPSVQVQANQLLTTLNTN